MAMVSKVLTVDNLGKGASLPKYPTFAFCTGKS